MATNQTTIKPLTTNGMGGDGYQLSNPYTAPSTQQELPTLTQMAQQDSSLSNIGSSSAGTTNGMDADGNQIGVTPSSPQPKPAPTPTTEMQTLQAAGMPLQSDPNYAQFWSSQPYENRLQAAVDGTWGGDSLGQFFDLRNDTNLPDEMRQQIAQAYSTRYGIPYYDPVQSTYVPPTNGMGADGGPVPGGVTTDHNYTGTYDQNDPNAPTPDDLLGTGDQSGGNGVPGAGGQPANTPEGSVFRDQGDGVYRGWRSPGPELAENTIGEDGRVQGNYMDTRGNEFRAESDTAATMGAMNVQQAQAAFAAENGRQMTQEELSAWQMNQVLSQDSPLMALARQDGVRSAERSGQRNSSLSAGAQMAAMARAATPLALQDSQAHGQMESQNQALESQRLEQNAGREQQTNLFNTDAENAATSQEFASEAQRRQFNAGLTTETNITNAGMANDLLNADRQRTYGMSLQQLAGDQDFSKQQIANQTAVDLANIEGQYKAFISENDTAARLFDSAYSAMASILGNTEIEGPEATEKINYIRDYLDNQMQLLLGFNMAGS